MALIKTVVDALRHRVGLGCCGAAAAQSGQGAVGSMVSTKLDVPVTYGTPPVSHPPPPPGTPKGCALKLGAVILRRKKVVMA